MRFSYDPESNKVEAELAKIEALRSIALQLERIADHMDEYESE